MGKSFWAGLSITIISFALAGGLAVLIAMGCVTKENAFIWLIIFGIMFLIGVDIFIWSLVSKSHKHKKVISQNSLSVGELLGYIHAHKCIKCGWGTRVDIFKKIATCPKCGNVDNI